MTVFEKTRELAEGFLAVEKKLPVEWDANEVGYDIGGLTDTATELLPMLDKADDLLVRYVRAAYEKGVRDAEDARDFAETFISDLREAEARV